MDDASPGNQQPNHFFCFYFIFYTIFFLYFLFIAPNVENPTDTLRDHRMRNNDGHITDHAPMISHLPFEKETWLQHLDLQKQKKKGRKKKKKRREIETPSSVSCQIRIQSASQKRLCLLFKNWVRDKHTVVTTHFLKFFVFNIPHMEIE